MSILDKIVPTPPNKTRTVSLGEGALFSYPLKDPYWQYYVLSGLQYEEEISRIFDLVKNRTALCLDCGANFGYWSVLLSRSVKTVAIEASTENFALLQLNSEINGGAFLTVQAAITDTGGSHVWFATKPVHAGRNITTEDNEDKERVATVTIDELGHRYKDQNGAIFVKLDVEGVEVEALEGSKETLRGDSVFVYEDHAKDRECLPTAYLLGEGKRIYYVDASGLVTPIRSVEDALRVKFASKSVGYNFVALGDTAPPLL